MGHGGSHLREYRVWATMVQRCENPQSAGEIVHVLATVGCQVQDFCIG